MRKSVRARLRDVVVTEVSRVLVAAEERIEGVNIAQVVHGTECEVEGDPALVVHPGLDGLEEVPDIATGALSTTTEVLASEFGRPDGEIEGVVHVDEVVNHGLGISSVEVNCEAVKMASTVAGGEEVLHPLLARRGVGAGGRNESVTLVLEGLDVLLPEGGSVAGVKIRLTRLVGLVEAQNTVSVTFFNDLSELTDLLGAPQHRARPDSEAGGTVGNPRRPSVESSDLAAVGEILQRSGIVDTPCQAGLALARVTSVHTSAAVVVATTSRSLGSSSRRSSLCGSGRCRLSSRGGLSSGRRRWGWAGLAALGVVAAPLLR